MDGKTLLAYIAGTVDQVLLLRHLYLVTENRILRNQSTGRLQWSDGERWACSVQAECLSRVILWGQASLRHTLTPYVAHVHHERNHQGKGNELLLPTISHHTEHQGLMPCRERLGGLLKYYVREAA